MTSPSARATGSGSPSTTRSISRGAPPRSASRTAPPTPQPPPGAPRRTSSARAPHGRSRSASRAWTGVRITGSSHELKERRRSGDYAVRMSRPSGGRRRRLVWAAAALVTLGVAAAVAVVVLTGRQGDVSNPDVEFDAAPPTAPVTTKPPTSVKQAKDPFDDGFQWPLYGLTKARTRYLPLAPPLPPPFTVRWAMTGSILLEFPPVLCGKSLYLLKNNGALYAVSRRTGKVRWKKKLGYLAAASPACDGHTVYSVVLSRGKGIRAGRVVAVAAYPGRTRWSRKLPSRAESSPLLDHGRLYFGSEDGTVYAMDAANGDVKWTYKAGGAVKGAVALDDAGRLFFGDYGGHVTALRRAGGQQLWQTGTSGGAFGLKSGNFYATPAVAFGRVYIGNTDGFVYSFGARDGKLAWRHKTGSYVYSSPALSPVLRRTVYAGSS